MSIHNRGQQRESTHVHQTHLLEVCSHKNSRQRMRQDLETHQCWAHMIIKGVATTW
jgi:hypothetical protein